MDGSFFVFIVRSLDHCIAVAFASPLVLTLHTLPYLPLTLLCHCDVSLLLAQHLGRPIS